MVSFFKSISSETTTMTTTTTTTTIATGSSVTGTKGGSSNSSSIGTTGNSQQQGQLKQQQEKQEECPICCNSMLLGDVRYPLVCPTKSCFYNYCTNCIINFTIAASDGYQLASDGSYQMKVTVKCPMCRSKYQILDSTTNNNNNNNNKEHQVSSSDSISIVQSIIILRNATEMEVLLNTDDCSLNASQLAKRDEYIRNYTIDVLEDAYKQVQLYNSSLHNKMDDKDSTEHELLPNLTVMPLDWTLFRSILRSNCKDHRLSDPTTTGNNNTSQKESVQKNEINGRTTSSTSANTSMIPTNTVAWKDPTILGGLEELMTVSEHEFITSMMISGQVETIAQAASILHGILEMSKTKRAQQTITQLNNTITSSTTGSSPVTTGNRKTTTTAATEQSNRPVRLSVRDIEHINRVKRRFPLPINMPRCVTVPVYDPVYEIDMKKNNNNSNKQQQQQQTVFNFAHDPKDKTKLTLQLKNVNGYAGKVGLRKGDIITHIDNIAIDTYDEFISIMSCRYNNHSCSEFNTYDIALQQNQQQQTPTIEIVVNATFDVANALQQRYYQMQKEKIRFLYN
jgi:hypothetical protein